MRAGTCSRRLRRASPSSLRRKWTSPHTPRSSGQRRLVPAPMAGNNSRSSMNDVQIIKRAAIPAITSIEEGGEVHLLGELRDFNWSEPLKVFLGSGSGFSASWVQLAHDEVLKPHTHPVLSMMVFYAGKGQMIGDLSQ